MNSTSALIPYHSIFLRHPGLRVKDMSDGPQIDRIAGHWRSQQIEKIKALPFEVKREICLVFLPMLMASITMAARGMQKPDKEIPYVGSIFVHIIALTLFSLGVYAITISIALEKLMNSEEVLLSYRHLSSSDINRMNLQQFFDFLRPWSNFTTHHRDKIQFLVENKKRIIQKIEDLRGMNLSDFRNMCVKNLSESRAVIRQYPYLYAFLVEHLPLHLQEEKVLLNQLAL